MIREVDYRYIFIFLELGMSNEVSIFKKSGAGCIGALVGWLGGGAVAGLFWGVLGVTVGLSQQVTQVLTAVSALGCIVACAWFGVTRVAAKS